MSESEKEIIRTLIRQTLKMEISICAIREILLAANIVSQPDFDLVVQAAEFDQDGTAHQMLLDLLGPKDPLH